MSALVHIVYYTGFHTGAPLPGAADLLARANPSRRERWARQTSEAQRALELVALRLLEIGMREAGQRDFRLADVAYPVTNGLPDKPYWLGGQADFSLAHTSGLAVCAIAGSCRVGIDAEAVRAIDPRAVARLLRPDAVLARDLDERNALSRWTQIESVLKGAGIGVMHGREIDWRGDAIVLRGRRWWVHAIECGAGHVMHAAVDAADVKIDITRIAHIE